MHLKSSLCYVIMIMNVLFAGCINNDESGSHLDGIEEVSIEAVDEDVQQSTLSTSFNDKASDKKNVATPSSAESLSSTNDNSTTAVATVYPDIGGTLTNVSVGDNGSNSTNSTTNNRYLRVKVSCSELYHAAVNNSNATLSENGSVEIVNMTFLLHGVLITNPAIKTRTMPSNCTVVLFYTHWCPWSAKAAPHFNALPRAFRNIRFAAIDSSVHTAINTYFGILSVPSVVLFYNGKILAKFNETTFNVNHFADFISAFTDQKPGIRLNVTSFDFIGPIPSTITKGPDWYLFISWVFIILVFIYYMAKTSVWHRILELVQNSWREAEAVASVPPPPAHFHQD